MRPQLQELAGLLLSCSPDEGVNATSLPGVSAIRVSQPGDEMTHALHQPAVCLIAQGAKRVMLRADVYAYDPSRVLVFTVDLPVSAQVTLASRAEPYLGFRLDIDPIQVADIVVQSRMPPPAAPAGRGGLYLSSTTPELLDAVLRLMRLAGKPDEAVLLAPLAVREILIRLLQGPEGHRLASVASGESHAGRVAKAIAWMKLNRSEPLRIEEIAHRVHMSPSSFHLRFRELTSMSPLQYHKQLRLQEARRLMLAEGADAATASHRVGYQSPSQFSREYGRQFGTSPARDIQRLRHNKPEAASA
ncbi:AraC family transcriptional regulator N-terminal domain-containing protein [Rubrivivax sp. RP6-9]|uniref:AraC family transcriptional regulator n=1 Tax=Rubrivivax sp. RP6-9 TaxID=3415750 RepID=UPI003CC5B008